MREALSGNTQCHWLIYTVPLCSKFPTKTQTPTRSSGLEGAAKPFSSKGSVLVPHILSLSFFSFSFSYVPSVELGFSHCDRSFIIYTWYEPCSHLIFLCHVYEWWSLLFSIFLSFFPYLKSVCFWHWSNFWWGNTYCFLFEDSVRTEIAWL